MPAIRGQILSSDPGTFEIRVQQFLGDLGLAVKKPLHFSCFQKIKVQPKASPL
jgi:hypothetical protein